MLLEEDVVMRTYDFAPLFRSTVGFDRLFDMLDNSTRSDWPPYNIEKRGENQYRISMAIAGFGPTEIELTQQGNTLLVTGQKKTEQDNHEMLHQGLAYRGFKQTFNLADHVKVTAANLENGLLSVELTREVPEQMKPRRIELSSPTISGRDNQQKLADQGADRETQAA
jgi:molecular chaperone IbpA